MKIDKFIYFIKFITIFLIIIIFISQATNAEIKSSELFKLDYSHVDFIDDSFDTAQASSFESTTKTGEGFNSQNMIVQIIKYLLLFIGIIAVSVIMTGGFKFMVAGGSSDNLTNAKNNVISGIIGLVVVITSYSVVGTVVEILSFLIRGSTINKLS